MTLEVKNLSVASVEDPDKKIVRDVSFSLDSGQAAVLMGKNGSGKSTLVNAILGSPKYEITDGTILLDGEDITDLSTPKKAKKGLFLSLQYLPEIEGVTLSSFLRQAKQEITGEDIDPLSFFKSMSEKVKDAGLDAGLLERPLNAGLSGGEKKQSEIIQLIALAPHFAFLDEIDSGVDVNALKKVFAAIEKLRADGMGVLLITHYPSILNHVSPEKALIIKDGEITASGGGEVVTEIEEKGFE